ncbi:MAG: alpha-ketoacid dehydrogenase subunit beta [Acidobacteria bacterium]|nr:alpha-ketoacid dehydrogenase subunit beta [Acidobacteriota bacterium]
MREITYVQAINEAITEEMERDERVFLMGEDIRLSAFGQTAGLVERFGPERVRNTPISETGFVGAGIGAALTGFRPIVEIQIASFFWVTMDQVCNQASKLRYMSGGQATLPLTIRSLYGVIGSAAAQHSETLYSSFLNVPGLKIAVPSTPYDVKGMLKTAIRDDNPVLFFEHMRLGAKKGPVPEEEYLVPLGQASVVREGSDATVVAIGWMVDLALEAATSLAAEGISVEVVDVRSLVPLDRETILQSVGKTGRLVVADEAHKTGSAASEIAAVVAEEGFALLRAPIKRVTALDTPIPFSPVMEQFVIPDAGKIAAAVRQVLG